jgi:hypothetical protein
MCLRAASAVLLFTLFTGVTPAWAHPPYEHLERVVTDGHGRQFQVFKSYRDGIFFTDPVTLVIRDADDRTVAETGYGRNVAMLCWRPSTCAVFRYEEFWSVLPLYRRKSADPDGIICFPALALSRIAKTQGLSVEDNGYLPARLVPLTPVR